MNFTDWIASIAALFSAIAAFVSAIISARWGQQYEKAKNAQIQATETIVKAKDSQIETLNTEIGLLRDMLSPKMRESFVSMREQLEEYNESLKDQLTSAKSQIAELQSKQTSQTFNVNQLNEVESERSLLQQRIHNLENEIKELQDIKSSTATNGVSSRQHQMLNFIENYIKDKGEAPSANDIAIAMGTTSRSAVSYYLNSLVDKGLVMKKMSNSRTVYFSLNK